MYDKYFLSKDQLDTTSNWLQQSNEPLFICGPSGIGKTSLAKDILKNTSLTVIDSLFLKNNSNIYDYLVNIIRKRNITLMFSQTKEQRGIIIDDLELFKKYDKKNFKLVIDLLLTYQYFGTKIIIVCNFKTISHKLFNKLKYSKIELIYSLHLFHKIVNNICFEKNIDLSFQNKQKYIRESNYNLNTLITLLDTDKLIDIQKLDDFSSEKSLLENLFIEDYSAIDINRLYIAIRVKISFDLLENLFNYFDIKTISSIYDYYVFSDILDTVSINYQNMNEYSCLLTIYNIHYLIKKNTIKYKPMINNKYLSRSLINTHSQKINYEYKSEYRYFIFIYLFMIKNNNYDSIIDKVYSINRKELEFYIKSFNYFYNDKIKIDKIYKLKNK